MSLVVQASVNDILWLGLRGVPVADHDLDCVEDGVRLQERESEAVLVVVTKRVGVGVSVALAVARDSVAVRVQELGVAVRPVPVFCEGDAERVDRERDQLGVLLDGVKDWDLVKETVPSTVRVPVPEREGLRLPDGDGVTVGRLLVCVRVTVFV